MAMKLTTGILAMAMMAGVAGAQNPDTTGTQAQQAAAVSSSAKPAPGAAAKPQAAEATATKPATKPANAAKPTVKPAAKPATASASTAKPAVKVTAAPAANSRSGAPAKVPATPKTQIPAAKAVFAARPPAAKPTAKALPAPATAKVAGEGSKPAAPIAAKPAIDSNKKSDPRKSADSGKIADASKQAKPEEKKWSMTGKRDPFFSPVVSQTGGSGCSTGKKCLEIGQINLRGVVKSENGFIAVVTNTLNKAYFLREKDPVFNGYVVRITGDSVVFQETVQDKLGKAFTREVVKRIFTPAV
jgi:Tfp pilus assembly protein PilP